MISCIGMAVVRRRFVEVLLVSLAVLVAVALLPQESCLIDEAYQNLAVMNYKISPMAPLTYYIGHLWVSVAGSSLVSLRVLMLLCYTVSISIGLWYFYSRTRDGLMASLLFFVLVSTCQVWSMPIYNWDTGCNPFMMLCMTAALSYYRRPDLRHGIMLAAAWAFMTASRLPIGVALPFLVAEVIWCNRGDVRGWLRQLLWGASVCAAIFVCLVWVIYGGLDGIEAAWAPENIITGHLNPMRLLERFEITTVNVLLYSYVSVAAALLAYICTRIKAPSARWMMYAVSAVLLAAITRALHMRLPQIMFATLLPVTLGACLYPLYRKYSRGVSPGRDVVAEMCIMLLFMFVPCFGSDGFFERVPMVVFPVVLVPCWPYLKGYFYMLVTLLGVAALSMFVLNFKQVFVRIINGGMCGGIARFPRQSWWRG